MLSSDSKTSGTICIEVAISKKKWCILFADRPPQNSRKAFFFNVMPDSLDKMKSQQDNVIDFPDKSKDTKSHIFFYLRMFYQKKNASNYTKEHCYMSWLPIQQNAFIVLVWWKLILVSVINLSYRSSMVILKSYQQKGLHSKTIKTSIVTAFYMIQIKNL